MARPRLRKFVRPLLISLGLLVLFLGAAGGGTMTYFHYASPANTCLSCHEMQGQHDRWAASAHKAVHCRECHGGSLTLNTHALKEHANRLVGHFKSPDPDHMRLSHEQVLAVSKRCESCHDKETAQWRKGGHSATFATIFLNDKQNHREHLNADCLRCHGMFAQGTTEELVSPIDTKGPWKLTHPEMADQPTMPCLACHQLHAPAAATLAAAVATTPPTTRPIAAGLYARHEKAHVPAHLLPVAAVRQGERAVKVSADATQRLCTQCHAPRAQQAMSADDRTPIGVHEGISCASCHDAHSGEARNSCATCHTPATSHCGLDVQKMDTTFLSPQSRHNVHAVSCADCHNGHRPAAATRPVALYSRPQ